MKNFLLKTILLLCTLMAGSGTMWATAYISYNGNTQDKSTTISSANVSSGAAGNISWTGTSCSYGSSRVNIAANGSITFTASTGYSITKIVITSGSSSSYYGTWTSSPSVTPTSSSGTTTFDGLSSSSVTVTTSTAFRCTSASSIKIYYTAAAAKTDPTITFNNGSVRVGQNLDLSTLFSSNSTGTVTYSITAGGSYASIDGSTLTGVAEGSVTVKAAQAAAGNYNAGEASATITVNPALTLSSIAITTPPTKTTYTEGETFDPTGMVVTATYSDTSTDDVTASCTFSPSTALTTSDAEITVSYTENAVEKTTTQAITVNAYVQPTSVTFNMNYAWLGSSNGSNISSDKLPVVKSQDNVTVTITDGSSTHPRGDGDYIRVYNGSTITFAAPSGYDIKEITFTAGGSGTWNAPSVNSGTLSNKVWSGAASSVVFTLSGTCYIRSAELTLAKQKALSSIAVSGTYPTVFEVGDDFSHEGAVVTATYDDASNADITSKASFSTPDMSSAGVKTITVSYTENAVEKTTTYDITVKAPATLESIALSGTYPTTFNVGDAFSHEGMTVTANFDDETSADVTASATFTDYNMSTAGVQTVTVSYTHKGVTTKTTTYNITVNTVAVTGVTVAPTSATVKVGKTVTLTPTISPANATNKNVTWESSNPSIATVDGGVVTGVAAGEATITVKSAADPTKSASCTITVITAGDGSKANPYDVEEALEIISGYSSGSGSAENVYTKGIVYSVGSIYNSTMLTYFISIDGTSENTIQVFRGKNLGNTNFAATSDISVNDEVIVYGQLYKYNTTSEINTGNYLYSLNGVKIPEITFGAASYEVAFNGSLTITATADCSGTITYSSSDNTVAEINETTGVVTPHKAGEVTITANVAASANNIAGSKNVTLTVTDGRAAAGIEFADAAIEKTWGESFTGQALTNPNSLAATYESSDETVASVVEATGVVTIVKAGTTTITASFAGDGDYMPAEVSYTLTVNKAAAGLSFTVTAYDFDLNDDSFTGVAVNNPNSLAVTYASSDDAIASVDENNGTLVLDASSEGSVTITASFAGNDNYNAGNASYTITITDPNKKGSKKNPYTVAEIEGQSSATKFGNDIYVTGYIVGCVKNNKCYRTTTANLMDTNLLLADTPDASFTEGAAVGSNTDGLIPVELPNSPSSIRKDWGVASNNNVIGYKVLLKGNAQAYFGTNAIKGTSEITAVSVSVTVGAAGYTTITTEYAVSFDGTDVTAYKAAAVNSASISLVEVEEAPAGTPLIIKATEGKHTDISVITSATAIDDNLLQSSDGSVVGDGSTIYALGRKSGIVGFYRVNSGVTVPAGKAYINTGAGIREFLEFTFDDETGITEITEKTETTKKMFDLSGRRVVMPSKGLYIVNGKKYIKK